MYSSSSKCSFKLFYTLIRPIICYGCEVWSPFLLKGLKDGNFINICDKLSGETLHIKICKLILGVHRKASNHAVRGELGSYPLLLFMLSLSLKYWWKLNNDCLLGKSSLAVQALLEDRSFQGNNYFIWFRGIKCICNLIGKDDVWVKPNILCKTTIVNVVTSSLKTVYDSNWFSCISADNSKLRTYCKFKTMFQQDNYILFFNRTSRSAFSKIRISAHCLRIEKGRYSIPKILPEDRICQVCDMHEIEDEYHFIMRCKLYECERKKLLSSLSDFLDIDNLPPDQLFITLMSSQEYDIVKTIVQFTSTAYEIRNNVK